MTVAVPMATFSITPASRAGHACALSARSPPELCARTCFCAFSGQTCGKVVDGRLGRVHCRAHFLSHVTTGMK